MHAPSMCKMTATGIICSKNVRMIAQDLRPAVTAPETSQYGMEGGEWMFANMTVGREGALRPRPLGWVPRGFFRMQRCRPVQAQAMRSWAVQGPGDGRGGRSPGGRGRSVHVLSVCYTEAALRPCLRLAPAATPGQAARRRMTTSEKDAEFLLMAYTGIYRDIYIYIPPA